MTVQPGQTLQHYLIVEKISEDGEGVVWRAIDTRHDRDVAIRVLPDHLADDEQALARYESEARAAAAVSHANNPVLLEVGRTEGIAFAVTELPDGQTGSPIEATPTFRPGTAAALLMTATLVPLAIYLVYLWYQKS